MLIIEIAALDNGAHRNQNGGVSFIPDGWAVVPDGMEMPNFPFGEVEVAEINVVMTVTKWTAGVIPKTEHAQPEPTQLDRIEAQTMWTALMTDTLLEEV